MDRYTAAAMQANIATMGDAFMQMNDPQRAAQARLLRTQETGQGLENQGISIKNSFLPGLSRAKMAEDNASAEAHHASAGLANSQTANWNLRNEAGNQLVHPPLTVYSQGAAAGGQDEMQDSWTNKGFTATGQNLSPGVLAAGNRSQLGDVYTDQNGKSYIAADLHGNKDKSVLDVYQDGKNYNPNSVRGLQLTKVGHEAIKYGDSADSLAQKRAKYERQNTLSNVFNGGGAADLATGQAKSAALTAPDELSMRRALGAQGQVMGQGEYFDPASSNAFQDRALSNAYNIAGLHEQGDNLRKSAEIMAGGAGGNSAAGGGVGGGASRNPLDAVNGAELTAKLSAERFGMAGADGKPMIDPGMRSAAIAWEASVSNLTEKGVPIQTAISIADQHHNVSGVSRTGDGWFDGDPRMQTGEGFDPASITPNEAEQFGASYAMSPAGSGQGGARMFAAGMLNPQIAQFAQQAGQAPPVQAPPVQQQPVAVPMTGGETPHEARASDEFKPRESSKEQEVRATKETRIKGLQAGIAEITSRLRSGSEARMPAGVIQGGMGGAYAPPANIGNDSYNENRERLIEMKAELAKLSALPPAAAPQTAPKPVTITGIREK